MRERLSVWREKARIFSRLAPWERGLLAGVVLRLPVLALGVRLLGFQRTWRLLAWFAQPRAVVENVAESRGRAVRIAGLAAMARRNLPFRAGCLADSLALWWALRRCGLPGRLRIGVRKGQGAVGGDSLQAHAWVEFAGTVLNDRPDVAERYAVFAPAIDELVVLGGGEH
ncbi:MAG TPA: lasso peptide biosynthesis B2 protein [Anaerolineales bacterium]|nr:lasso peptide biosynthesis B2 protein [Anaerolineales bacterium]